MFFKTILKGAKLSTIWPDTNRINNVFKVGYIIKGVNCSKKVIPPILALFIVWYFIYYNYVYISYKQYVLFSAIFFIFICLLSHLYALYCIGKFAQTELSGKVLNWYKTICDEIGLQPHASPNFMTLIKAINKSFNIDKNSVKKFKFWEEL